MNDSNSNETITPFEDRITKKNRLNETHKISLYASNIIYGGMLLSSPIWGGGVLLSTLMMNDSERFNQKFQLGCFLSLISTPITLCYTLYHNNRFGYSNKVTMSPIYSILSYGVCLVLFFKDEKKENK